MKCYECGGEYSAHRGTITIDDKFVGRFDVPNVEFMKCNNCQNELYSPEVAQIISAQRKASLDGLIRDQPIGDFVSAPETERLLGISRQALNQNRRIRRGFIFQTKIGGKTVYLRKSVLLFKKKGDGRFMIGDRRSADTYRSELETAHHMHWLEMVSLKPTFREAPLVITPSDAFSNAEVCAHA